MTAKARRGIGAYQLRPARGAVPEPDRNRARSFRDAPIRDDVAGLVVDEP